MGTRVSIIDGVAQTRARAVRAAGVAALAALIAAAALAVTAHPAGAQTPTPGRSTVLAPIESVEVQVAPGAVPQYRVQVVSGLPGGCVSFGSIAAARSGARIDVTVLNTVNITGVGACTTIYGFARNTVDIGADFEPGVTYTVVVNSAGERPVSRTFTTATAVPAGQAPAAPPAGVTPVAPPVAVTPVVPRPANTGGAEPVPTPATELPGGVAAVLLAASLAMIVAARIPGHRPH